MGKFTFPVEDKDIRLENLKHALEGILLVHGVTAQYDYCGRLKNDKRVILKDKFISL